MQNQNVKIELFFKVKNNEELDKCQLESNYRVKLKGR